MARMSASQPVRLPDIYSPEDPYYGEDPVDSKARLNELVAQGIRNFYESIADPKAFHTRAAQNLQRSFEESPEDFAMNFTGGGLGGVTKFKGIPLTELLYPGRAASGLTSAEKTAVTKFEKALRTPAVRRREEMALAGGDVVTPTPGVNLIREIAINPEQLLGKRLVPVTGDLSTVGGDVRQIAGVPLSSPVSQQGGRLYPTIEQNVRQGVAWASEPTSASGKVKNLNKFANEGDDTVGVFVGMSPQGINFSHHVAEAMVRQLPELKVSKDAIRELNAEIRNYVDPTSKKAKFKNFAGVDSPNIEELMSKGTKDFSAGDLRKVIVEKMGKTHYKNMGFPDYQKTLKVMTEPGLFQGEAGRTMFTAQPNSKMVTPEFEHRSYSAGIPGQYMGGIASPTGGTTGVPRELLFPKLFADFAKRKTPETGINRSLMMAHHGELFDELALVNLLKYLNQAPAQ